MRLLEAIIDANHRALTGDNQAGLHLSDYGDQLPLVALTCIDPRLNRLFPGALALSEQNFVWLRNAGNIIFDPMSSMMRSLALACAVKGGKEIAIIGHSDCQVRHTPESELIKRFQAVGVPRRNMPDDLASFFGIFNDERDNVLKSVNFVRSSPLIGPRVPVHGLMIDTPTGRLDWVVNGYDALRASPPASALEMPALGSKLPELSSLGSFDAGAIKFPEQKIGEFSTSVPSVVAPTIASPPPYKGPNPVPPPPPPASTPPPAIRVPPPLPTKDGHTGSWRSKR